MPDADPDFEAGNRRLIQDQLAARGIRNPRVLAAFGRVHRHLFVPEPFRQESYTDRPLPIGAGQTISQPYIVALMTEHLDVLPESRVLEIGTGSGFQTAILAELGKEVYSIERLPELAQRALILLTSLGYRSVHIRVGDGSKGWPEKGPFDRILVAAAAPRVPVPLLEQMTPSGRMVIPIGAIPDQSLLLIEREKGKIRTRRICGCLFVPFVGEHAWHEEDADPHETDIL